MVRFFKKRKKLGLSWMRSPIKKLRQKMVLRTVRRKLANIHQKLAGNPKLRRKTSKSNRTKHK